MSKKIITITGPSCSGKSTLANMLVATGTFTEVISTTTRPMRAGETNGTNYHFVTPEEFSKIEMLERIEFNGNIYGGSVVEFEAKFASGKIPAIVVEPNGLMQINENAKKKDWEVINIFVDCPPLLQADRFLSRLIEDYRTILAAGDSDKYIKLMKEYTNRMATMQSVESKWFDLFEQYATHKSAFVIPTFGKENEDKVIESIIERVCG